MLQSHVPVDTTHRQTDLGQGEQPLWLRLLSAGDVLTDLEREELGPQWRREASGESLQGEHRAAKATLELNQRRRERPPAAQQRASVIEPFERVKHWPRRIAGHLPAR